MKHLPPLDMEALRLAISRSELEAEGEIADVELRDEHSNHVAVVQFGSGRRLIVKRPRTAELGHRFDTSVVASHLLREGTDLLVPEYLEVLPAHEELPTLVYWWIDRPTLAELWPELGERDRASALAGCGDLLGAMHRVRLAGHGPLLTGRDRGGRLLAFVEWDLDGRLRPAMEASWPEQSFEAGRLLEHFTDLLTRRGEPDAVLVHNDVFAENVLCERDSGAVRCVGVIDFEDSFAGPREADLAKTEILHGPLFGRPFEPGWFTRVLEGYGEPVDAQLVALFRAYHLLNMGYHAAATGLAGHAAEVAVVLRRELDRWEEGARHADVAV